MGCGCALLVVALGVCWVRNAATDELSLRPLLISPRLHLSTAGIRRPADNKKLEHVLGGSPRAETTFAAGLGYSWAGTGQNGLVRVLGQVTFFVSPGPFFLKRIRSFTSWHHALSITLGADGCPFKHPRLAHCKNRTHNTHTRWIQT